jgi:hypothetical protein
VYGFVYSSVNMLADGGGHSGRAFLSFSYSHNSGLYYRNITHDTIV